MHIDNPSLFKGSVEPALGTIHDYMQAIVRIKKETKIQSPITLEMLIRLPNIFNVQEHSLDKQSVKIITKATQELITAVIHERQKEGNHIKKDLAARFASMKQEINAIATRFEAHLNEQKEKLTSLIQELNGDESEHLLQMMSWKKASVLILPYRNLHEKLIRLLPNVPILALVI
jgi:uncharacterized protein YicC (UPF0701 family)